MDDKLLFLTIGGKAFLKPTKTWLRCFRVKIADEYYTKLLHSRFSARHKYFFVIRWLMGAIARYVNLYRLNLF